MREAALAVAARAHQGMVSGVRSGPDVQPGCAAY